MKRVVHFGLAASLVAYGCAAGDVLEPPPTNADPSADAATDGATNVDAGVDARVPLPECSVEGFCNVKLPLEAGNVSPDPNGVRLALTSVWVAPDHKAWAVTATGHVLRWDGSTWSVVLVANAGLRSVWGSSANDVWLAGDAGTLLHGTGSSGALNFQAVASGTAQKIHRVWGTSASDIWLVTDRVSHLTPDSMNTATPFIAVDVPSGFGTAAEYVRINAVWGTASDTWFGGTEVSHCAPPKCENVTRTYAARRRVAASGAVTWDTVATPVTRGTGVVAGVSTTSGVQALAIPTSYFETAAGAWIAEDASKLDPRRGAITVSGAYAYNSEITQEFGQPEGMWGRDLTDLWVVGRFGVVRHFDGKDWQVPRVSRTNLAPVLNHLHGVDALVEPSGERDLWIVGDDIAIHRRGMP